MYAMAASDLSHEEDKFELFLATLLALTSGDWWLDPSLLLQGEEVVCVGCSFWPMKPNMMMAQLLRDASAVGRRIFRLPCLTSHFRLLQQQQRWAAYH